MTKMAKYLDCEVSHISMWFSEIKKDKPRKNPTSEQALAMEAFLNFVEGQDDLSNG